MATTQARPGLSGLADGSLLLDKAFVGGAWIAASDGKVLEVVDPATGAIIGSVPDCTAADTQAAIDAARAASPEWRARPAAERAAILEEWHRLIVAHADDLATIMTVEQGKPLAESRGEIAYSASFVKWFAQEGLRVYGHEVPSPMPGRRILVRKEPVGVCAAITPWNFPSAMITRKVAPALAVGCTMVVKPSELTPYSALALARLGEQAGIPAGVLNIVTGLPTAIGEVLTCSPDIRLLSFTGSTRVGALLMRQSAGTVKKLALELGGNAPFIVFDDADLDLAIEGVMASKFRNAGQTCVCANRILVQSGIHDAFVARLGAAVRALKVGHGADPGVAIGPLINPAADTKVAEHVADALGKGAAIAARAETPEGFTAPLVLTGVDTRMRLAQEETFGPVAPIFRFDDEADAVAIANATPFGLAAYYFTSDIDRAWRVGEALEFGIVGLNTGAVSMAAAPFGGMKQSGLGREGGAEGIEEYLETKTFHWAGLKGL
ncbi:MAG TPA: NAD-dependent succinate-semialdehyde dehydrogenase [Sphingomonas sp.]|nr:NAD-dependent succinate-semialdehyde dehydrogenase [Sphingomonas sp.]